MFWCPFMKVNRKKVWLQQFTVWSTPFLIFDDARLRLAGLRGQDQNILEMTAELLLSVLSCSFWQSLIFFFCFVLFSVYCFFANCLYWEYLIQSPRYCVIFFFEFFEVEDLAILFWISIFGHLLLLTSSVIANPAANYMFKVSNRNTRARCKICSKLTIKTTERRQWCRSGVFIVYFEHIPHLVLVFLLLTLSK